MIKTVLYLPIKKQWFDMIKSGVKTEEYREFKKYYISRFQKKYNIVEFRNGYASKVPSFRIELINIIVGRGRKKWGAPRDIVFILKLGNILTGEP